MPKTIEFFNDKWLKILKGLYSRGREFCARGDFAKEFLGYKLVLENPRDRLIWNTDRAISLGFGCREFIWGTAGRNDLESIKRYSSRYALYSDDGRTLYGAFGKRILDFSKVNQIRKILKLFKQDLATRRALLVIADPRKDFKDSKNIPCASLIQFLIRNNKVNMISYWRSEDIMYGVPYDVFFLSLFQEVLASLLFLDLGTYVHIVGSLHLYFNDKFKTEFILGNIERQKSKIEIMPQMPFSKNTLRYIQFLDELERKLYSEDPSPKHVHRLSTIASSELPSYWMDFWWVFLAYYFANCKMYEELPSCSNMIDVILPFKSFLNYKYETWRKK